LPAGRRTTDGQTDRRTNGQADKRTADKRTPDGSEPRNFAGRRLGGIGKQQQSKYQVNACGSPLGQLLETKSGNGSLPSNSEFSACAAYLQYQ